jgi:hypothetical protein
MQPQESISAACAHVGCDSIVAAIKAHLAGLRALASLYRPSAVISVPWRCSSVHSTTSNTSSRNTLKVQKKVTQTSQDNTGLRPATPLKTPDPGSMTNGLAPSADLAAMSWA